MWAGSNGYYESHYEHNDYINLCESTVSEYLHPGAVENIYIISVPLDRVTLVHVNTTFATVLLLVHVEQHCR